MSNKKFPRDCTADCLHFHTWDMSIDDWTCVCDKFGVQIDECDMGFNWMFCPLKENEIFDRKLEYHEGYYAAGNDIPYDENASEAWKEGYRDGCASLFGDE